MHMCLPPSSSLICHDPALREAGDGSGAAGAWLGACIIAPATVPEPPASTPAGISMLNEEAALLAAPAASDATPGDGVAVICCCTCDEAYAPAPILHSLKAASLEGMPNICQGSHPGMQAAVARPACATHWHR